MNKPLMPRATALWLLNHTCLTKTQISDFCDIHSLALDVLKNSNTLQELDPLMNGQLTREEIQRCECDADARLILNTQITIKDKSYKKYTPLSKRSDIPNAILWLVQHHPELPDAKICQLLSTTRTMVKNIREGTYWNLEALTAKDPVLLGLCSENDLILDIDPQ